MKTNTFFGLCLIAMALIVGCEKSDHSKNTISDGSVTQFKSEAPKDEALTEQNAETLQGNGTFTSQDSVTDDLSNPAPPQTGMPIEKIEKKLIKNGNLSMEVNDYKATRQKINGMVPKYKAYIGAENETNDHSRIQGNVTIRVPFNQFDALMEAIAGEGEYIANKNVTVDDVTAEYVDLSARLKTKLEVEARYRDILKKAAKIPDILSVENELRVIREEIEAAQGRMKYINDQATYSILTVEMYQVLPYSIPPQAGFFSNIARAFVNGWHGLLFFITGLIAIWPFLIILAVGIFFLRRFWKRKTV